MSKKLAEIEKQLNEILESGTQRIKEAEEKAKQAEENEKQHAGKLLKARRELNESAYVKESEELRAAKDIAKMYSERAHDIRKEPLVTEDEYKKLKTEIIAEYERESQAAKKESSQLLNQVRAIGEKLGSNIDLANELLRRLQRDIYREDTIKENPDGTRTAISDDHIRDEDVNGTLQRFRTPSWFSSLLE